MSVDTHPRFNLATRGATAFAILLFLVLLYPAPVPAEPLGYVARPDRSDLGVFDPRSHLVWGAIGLDASPTTVAISPDGTTVYVGLSGAPPVRVDTLNATVADFPADSYLGEVQAIVFHPSEPTAFLASDRAELFVVDTTEHALVETLDLPYPLDELRISADGEWVVGRRKAWRDNVITVLHTASRLVVEKTLPTQRELLSLRFGRDGLFHALGSGQLTRFGLKYHAQGPGGGAHEPVELTDEQDLFFEGLMRDSSVDPFTVTDFALTAMRDGLYLGHDGGVVAIRCERYLQDSGTEPYDCYKVLDGPRRYQRVESTDIDMTTIGNKRGLESLQDLQLLPDESRVYAIGRRAIAGVDTATHTLEGDLRMVSGGGYLGNVAFAGTVASCVARSTSIPGLKLEIKSLDTGEETIRLMQGKIDKARKDLRDGNTTGARYALDALIGRAVWRSSLAENDPELLSQDDAASIICAASNLIGRLDPYPATP